MTTDAGGGGKVGEPLSYAALHESFNGFVRRAGAQSSLPDSERRHAGRASAHWLRHTDPRRAAEAGLPADVLQGNLRHADHRTTDGYDKTQLDRRWAEIERVYGEQSHP